MKTAIVLALVLTGCASLPQGVEMTEEERTACAAQGCSVWTVEELQRLIVIATKRGFDAGKKRKGEISI